MKFNMPRIQNHPFRLPINTNTYNLTAGLFLSGGTTNPDMFINIKVKPVLTEIRKVKKLVNECDFLSQRLAHKVDKLINAVYYL